MRLSARVHGPPLSVHDATTDFATTFVPTRTVPQRRPLCSDSRRAGPMSLLTAVGWTILPGLTLLSGCFCDLGMQRNRPDVLVSVYLCVMPGPVCELMGGSGG